MQYLRKIFLRGAEMNRKTIIIILAAALLVVIAGFMSCSSKGSSNDANNGSGSTGTLTINGVMESSQIAAPSFTSSIRSAGSLTTGCDGPSSTCCEPGTGCDPDSAKVTVYKIWVSASTDCSNPILVEDKGTSGAVVDIALGGQLFSGTVAPGSYPCMIWKVEDLIEFVPNGTSAGLLAACTASTHYMDMCRSDVSQVHYDFETGQDVTCHGTMTSPSADQIYWYFSTDPAAVQHEQYPLTIGAPLVIVEGATTVGYYNWSFADAVVTEQDQYGVTSCWLGPGSEGPAAFVIK